MKDGEKFNFYIRHVYTFPDIHLKNRKDVHARLERQNRNYKRNQLVEI